MGHRTPHIIHLVTTGKGALRLPPGAPPAYEVRPRPPQCPGSRQQWSAAVSACAVLCGLGLAAGCGVTGVFVVESPAPLCSRCTHAPPPTTAAPLLPQALMQSCLEVDYRKRPRWVGGGCGAVLAVLPGATQDESLPACLPPPTLPHPASPPVPRCCSFEQLLAAINAALQSGMETTAAAVPPPMAAEMCGGPDCFAKVAEMAAAGLIDAPAA